MNNGFFGFPSPSSETSPITEIDSSRSYRIEPGTKRLCIFAVGGGGGGGGGAANSGNSSGGGGGAGGSIVLQEFDVDDLGGVNSTLLITIGAGGTAGAAAVGSVQGGGAGGIGGYTFVSVSGKGNPTTDPRYIIIAPGGGAAAATGGVTNGNSTGGTARSGLVRGISLTQLAGTSCVNGQSGASITITSLGSNAGTAGGGNTGVSSGGQVGGNIGITSSLVSIVNPRNFNSFPLVSGGTLSNGGPGRQLNKQIAGKMSPGFGGTGGGGGNVSGGAGAPGYRGSGGGGGGSSNNTPGGSPGAGGKVGDGYVGILAIK
jgi:hypothetical protein